MLRHLQNQIENWLFKGKVIILYGPRQSGKTTLSKAILDKHSGSLYFNCEIEKNQQLFEQKNPEQIKAFLGEAKLVVLDEAQQVEDIGVILKLMIDTYPEVQIIATGSSSFELSGKINEPLTGRNLKYTLYPLSLQEVAGKIGRLQVNLQLEQFLRFGLYPGVALRSEVEMTALLDALAGDYLYKDVFKFEKLKRPNILHDILRALAWQLGQEVSYREIAQLVGTTPDTVGRYLELLEKTFVIFRLPTYSRNLRNEIKQGVKYYFYDLGIRNSLIQNYNPLNLRDDVGALWENFCVVERKKYNQAQKRLVNTYFWRTYKQQEVDYLEESGGGLEAFEFKYNSKRVVSWPKAFQKSYPEASLNTINSDNYWQFLF